MKGIREDGKIVDLTIGWLQTVIQKEIHVEPEAQRLILKGEWVKWSELAWAGAKLCRIAEARFLS